MREVGVVLFLSSEVEGVCGGVEECYGGDVDPGLRHGGGCVGGRGSCRGGG